MSDNRLDKTTRILCQLSATTLGALILCLWAIPFAQISIGSVYLHDCPRQPYIPIYLIVVGVFSLLRFCLPGTQNQQGSNPASTSWYSLISTFLLCWFIAGNMLIYSIYQPNYNKNTTDISTYCNKTVYLFAFWTTTLVYILVGAAVVCRCCCCCCYCCYCCILGSCTSHSQANPENNV